MPIKRPMTQQDFDDLLVGGWKQRELSDEVVKRLGLARPASQLGVIASGCTFAPKEMHGYSAVAGFDVLTYESRPDRSKCEPDGIAYHYIVIRTGRADWPFVQIGPFNDGASIEHWFDAPELDDYFNRLWPQEG